MQPQSPHQLRRRAEARVGPKEQSCTEQASRSYDLKALVHELQVHQVELEMQNDELRHAKNEVEESRNNYQELFDSAPAGYVTIDTGGRIQEANLAFAQFLGRSRAELLQQLFRSYVAPERRRDFADFCRRITSNVVPQTCELQILGPQERILDVHVEGSFGLRVSKERSRAQVRLVLVEITGQRQAERERESLRRKLEETQKLESLGVMAGGIAHDFNNLLTGILGNACLARSELARDSKAWPCLERIITASGRAAELCKQMLDYSGKGRLVVEPLNLNALINDTTPLLQLSTSKNVLLTTHLAPQLPDIGADPTQLRQVLMNLIINGSEAVSDRNGTVTISTGACHADSAYLRELHPSFDLMEGHYVYLEVRDDGCGMSEETLARIFDPFFTTKFTGRGLGLAAVLGIVRGHNGAIKVISRPGCGTIFTLLFPVLTPGAFTTAHPPVKSGTGDAAWRGHGTSLLVDDEEPVRNVIEHMLKRLGFEVVSAADGKQGLELFRAAPARFRAVLLDLSMPHLNGQGTLREIRRISSEARVLLMSGFSEESATNQCEKECPSGFLQKPFKPDELRERLRTILA